MLPTCKRATPRTASNHPGATLYPRRHLRGRIVPSSAAQVLFPFVLTRYSLASRAARVKCLTELFTMPVYVPQIHGDGLWALPSTGYRIGLLVSQRGSESRTSCPAWIRTWKKSGSEPDGSANSPRKQRCGGFLPRTAIILQTNLNLNLHRREVGKIFCLSCFCFCPFLGSKLSHSAFGSCSRVFPARNRTIPVRH